MGRYLIRRLLQALLLLALLSVGMFILIHALPGGPEQVIFNPRLSAAGRAAIRARFGLDQPLYIQYLKWLWNSMRGDFGFSFATNQPVSDLLNEAFPKTLELFISAMALALVVAISIGMISAVRQGTVTDYALTTLSYGGIAMPIFLLGLFAQNIFCVNARTLFGSGLPCSGNETIGVAFDPFNALLDHLTYLILPMIVLSITFVAGWSRYMRASMIEVTKQDYMRTARAKGVGRVSLLVRHGLRNAVIPLITVVALDFGQVAGGATITEGVFARRGMGLLFIDSLINRDYPVLLAMLLIGAVFVIIFNLLADLLYAVMDPRIRYA